MKKTILALLSCALVVSLSLMAADGDVVRKMKIKLKSGQTVEYVTDQIEKVSFVDGTPLADDMISVTDVGKDRFTFSIKTDGQPYRFVAVEQAMFGTYTPEDFLASFGYTAQTDYTYEWVDGQTYNGEPISVKPGVGYAVLAATCDAEGNITGDLHRVDFETLPEQTAQGTVSLTLSDVTKSSVRIKAVPLEGISRYIVYVRDKAWADNIISSYGEGMLTSVVERAAETGLAKSYTAESDEVWSGLVPSTEYYCLVVAQDNEGGKKLEKQDFTTAEGTGEGPEVTVGLDKSADKPYETATMTVRSKDAYLIRYVVMPTADVDERLSKGKTADDIISEEGTDLNIDEVALANTPEGFEINVENLWPETEYTAIVSARNTERITTTETAKVMLDAVPSPRRVESDLFDVLPGKWEMTYTFLDDEGKELTKTFEVEVAAGVDEHSAQEYRRLNRLVITGYQFAEEDIPYYSPDYLKQYGYWANNPSLMYRDYGPKIFLEIGEGDKVTVPTARNTPLAGYSNEWNFIGMDYDNRKIAAVAFPVTVSDDRNTLTIKEYDASQNMSFGVYRPAVMVKQTQMWNVAVTDIVMTRK